MSRWVGLLLAGGLGVIFLAQLVGYVCARIGLARDQHAERELFKRRFQ